MYNDNTVTPFVGFYAETYRQLHTEGLKADMSEIDKRQASMPVGESHWEFAAIALLHVAAAAGPLSNEVRAQLSQWVSRFNPSHPAGNWRLMSGIVNAALAHHPLDHATLVDALGPVGEDGHLPDVQGETSSQYHAYNLLLLARFGDTGDSAVCAAVQKGFAWLFEIDRIYGDPSPLGRGRFQTFGYAAMLAAARYAGGYGVEVSSTWEARVAVRLSGAAPNSGALPAFWDGPYRSHLLHGYNTPDDYPAFAEFWTPYRDTLAAPDGPATRYVLKDDWGTLVYAADRGPVIYLPDNTARPPSSRLARLLTRVGLRRTKLQVLPIALCSYGSRSLELLGDITQSMWSRPSSAAPVTTGCPEQSTLSWTGPTGATWMGRDVRVVRRGSLSVELG